jgi:hypothetical protein
VVEGLGEHSAVLLVGSDVVMAAAQILHEGVTGGEDPRWAVTLEPLVPSTNRDIAKASFWTRNWPLTCTFVWT